MYENLQLHRLSLKRFKGWNIVSALVQKFSQRNIKELEGRLEHQMKSRARRGRGTARGAEPLNTIAD